MGVIMRSKRGSPSEKLKLGMHEDSHIVSKLKPKIRIVHIFAPEVIKTDTENFRELVQRLTGKPAKEEDTDEKARNGGKEAKVVTKCINGDVRKKEGLWREEINSEGFVDGDIDEFLHSLGDLPLIL
ncbi:hypothetical protein J5N97_005461 [Dioscorea zingiberensis]|uniref:VQ domain-containing protein n=1 Tax=Dioscorea zingiberensis TaxID=325984 RepID=A0A9D5HRX1_9LILI|nr:hypothetical protein J5N97_000012 [Dioscorea zingiberensis]KAJ0987105.1 hypothetical protein J5N97_005461 [Dioscorea zingiberensis]